MGKYMNLEQRLKLKEMLESECKVCDIRLAKYIPNLIFILRLTKD